MDNDTPSNPPAPADPINPLAQAFIARYVAKAFLLIAGILGTHGVTISSKDNFGGVSYEIAYEILAIVALVIHLFMTKKINLHFFNVGRSVQAGVTPVKTLPSAPATIPPPAAPPVSK